MAKFVTKRTPVDTSYNCDKRKNILRTKVSAIALADNHDTRTLKSSDAVAWT